jgi:hypothetical protein
MALLRAQRLQTHQAADAILAAGLAQGNQLIPHFAIFIDRATFELGLFDVTEQPFIFDCQTAVWCFQPLVITARMSHHHLADTPHLRLLILHHVAIRRGHPIAFNPLMLTVRRHAQAAANLSHSMAPISEPLDYFNLELLRTALCTHDSPLKA